MANSVQQLIAGMEAIHAKIDKAIVKQRLLFSRVSKLLQHLQYSQNNRLSNSERQFHKDLQYRKQKTLQYKFQIDEVSTRIDREI